MSHPLAELAWAIDWRLLEEGFGAVYSDKPDTRRWRRGSGRMLRIRLEMAGPSILKQAHARPLDEVLCERWIGNPYYQLFCGGKFFQHKLTFDRSSPTRWRRRMGEEKFVALLQESLSVATRTGAAKPADFANAVVDTTVQPKAVAFPTDAKLMHWARERLMKPHAVANVSHKAGADTFARSVAPFVREAQGAGAKTVRAIAAALNRRGATALHGGRNAELPVSPPPSCWRIGATGRARPWPRQRGRDRRLPCQQGPQPSAPARRRFVRRTHWPLCGV